MNQHTSRHRAQFLGELGRFLIRRDGELNDFTPKHSGQAARKWLRRLQVRDMLKFYQARTAMTDPSVVDTRTERYTRLVTAPAVERRSEAVAEVAVRGRVHTFGSVYDLGDGMSESVSPSAFDETLRNKDHVTLNAQHDDCYAVASTTGGSLRLRSSAAGLEITADLRRGAIADHVLDNIDRRVVGGMSFSFKILACEFEVPRRDEVHCTITNLRLYDVASVGSPAYGQTTIQIDGDYGRQAGRSASRSRLREYLRDPDDESRVLKQWVKSLK